MCEAVDVPLAGEADYPTRFQGRAPRGECVVPADQDLLEAFGSEPVVQAPGDLKTMTVEYPELGQQLTLAFDHSARTVRFRLVQDGHALYDSFRPGLLRLRIVGPGGNRLSVETAVDGAASTMTVQVFPSFSVQDMTFAG